MILVSCLADDPGGGIERHRGPVGEPVTGGW
jgi:hypothetical protein